MALILGLNVPRFDHYRPYREAVLVTRDEQRAAGVTLLVCFPPVRHNKLRRTPCHPTWANELLSP